MNRALPEPLTLANMKMGGRYNWKNQPERLVYIGRNWSGNGWWHQFEKVDERGIVWCEVLDADLHMLEETEDAALATLQGLPAPQEAVPWRCFHCDATFTDADAACEHFGPREHTQPACQIDIAEYRRMQEAHRRQCEEDTEWHRTYYRLDVEHTQAMRRHGDEEYARGLRDGVNLLADSPERATLQGLSPAQATPEVTAEQYIAQMIDRGPEPLRRLADWLSRVLDEDEWKTAERMLLGAYESAAHPPAAAPAGLQQTLNSVKITNWTDLENYGERFVEAFNAGVSACMEAAAAASVGGAAGIGDLMSMSEAEIDAELLALGIDPATAAQQAADAVAAGIADARRGGYVCGMCGKATPHQHSPEEVVIFRNGIRRARDCWEQAKACLDRYDNPPADPPVRAALGERHYHAALQRIGWKLDLLPGADLLTEPLAAIEALRTEMKQLRAALAANKA